MSVVEAQCPICDAWSPVTFQDTPENPAGPGGWWWEAETPGCPACGELVLSVDAECDFRIRPNLPDPSPTAPQTEYAWT